MAHRELFQAFIGAAPITPQSLEAAITAFRAALGLPSPEHITWAPREKTIPPRVAVMLRTLGSGSALTSERRRPVRRSRACRRGAGAGAAAAQRKAGRAGIDRRSDPATGYLELRGVPQLADGGCLLLLYGGIDGVERSAAI
ncbi:hypothetical protein ABZ135_23035 [Streptomyces sp. NPDC006339]|uniref:hypothetical protein n=1 Tax=Streptomyces sp. NPDC006339 TaxID=3156755 RepID=UPI0033BA8CC6